MYAGDFTWDKESQAFYMRHRLSNGQFCMIEFDMFETNRAIEYYVAFAVADKKKALNRWFNGSVNDNITLKMTGRCGLEALCWCRDRLLEFESCVHRPKSKEVKIVVAGEDSKRLRMYSRALARYGYKKVPTEYGWTVQKTLKTQ